MPEHVIGADVDFAPLDRAEAARRKIARTRAPKLTCLGILRAPLDLAVAQHNDSWA
jgi:hypothetical protein